MDHQRLIYLIDQYLKDNAKQQEINELNDWYATVDFGDKALDDWIREEYGMEAITSRMFGSFQKRIKDEKRLRFRIVALRWVSAAAAVLIFASIILIFRNSTKPQIVAKNQPSVIKPGTNTAILTLGNGNKIVLKQQQVGKIIAQSGVVISKQQNGLITYALTLLPASQKDSKIDFNSIETPRGGEYQILLPDGTKVWLNAASKLTYPIRFAGKERTVKLTGEAYFEVAHNAHQPFHVLFSGQDVRVFGTHFNINAYRDEAESKTTLLQGSIALSSTVNHQSVLLTPGQQAASLTGSGKFTLQSVNTQQVVSWKNGYFQFDNFNIATIMKALSRWYDIDVKYDQVNLAETYGGTFSRDSNLQDILNNMSALGKVSFKMTGRTIHVTNKKGGL
ncbi:FecR family protein [Mucilaginibacter mallensis]|uniref:FecR family protein n=1 Tax=Mucilaginibacter mallensis TaxID=652787 RepID=A0A1H2CC95_MUCMA|nr:FecR family protein [Mucilaginibacter mallensis]SDT68175.1 FecR family protein [Mucilaginibacter mallensis]